ncbi:hypothetical protein WOLCODRAFT_164436 [Wolfiporia cocos MD-104 SS10]|uniref:Uncharacterized protein n=1 Tax=Wolfiporia cocos (strain MD-104) TaxID=742152 RepID=A0A2H3JML4_WOLCO|nr:hypothetical protein WOLCODRAFT_164436 [Wolfiporia cocos MD-104 SS10]
MGRDARSAASSMPSLTLAVDSETPHQSEQASLHGHRALTPLISGAVSGGTIGVAWVVGLLIYFYRRWKGHRAVRSAGLRSHRELDVPPPKPEPYIIPPDPAVIQGVRAPGERVVFDDPRADEDGHPRHAITVPLAQIEMEEKGRQRDVGMTQSTSAPQLPTSNATGPSTSTAHDRSTRSPFSQPSIRFPDR